MHERLFKQLVIQRVEGNLAWSLCPFHKDSNRPNFSISLDDKYLGKYKCWACGKGGQLTNAQIRVLGLNKCNTYKVNNTKLSMRWRTYINTCQENIQRFPLLKIALATELNVSTKSLDDWGIGFDGAAYIISMYRGDLDTYNHQNGICGAQRRFPNGTKRATYGSALGYMLPKEWKNYTIFICEGFSDGISVWDLGFDSIARPNCHYVDGIVDMLYKIGAGVCNIIIIPDNDDVGKAGAEKLCGILQEYFDSAIFYFDGVKDIRQLIQLKGKDYVRQQLGRYV